MSLHNFLTRLVLWMTFLQLATCAILSDSPTPKRKGSITKVATSTTLPTPLSSSQTSSSKSAKPTHAESSVSSCPIKRNGLFKRACSYQTNAPWALQRISQASPMSWKNDLDLERGLLGLRHNFRYNQKWGENVIVYVLDSGVNGAHHLFQKGQVEKGESISTLKGVESNPFEDTLNHGTGVASPICGQTTGIARSAKIFPIKICSTTVKMSPEALVEGINIAVKNWTARSSKNKRLRAVINLSSLFPYHVGIQAAFKSAEKAGMHIVSSAGNDKKSVCDHRAKNTGQIMVSSVKPAFIANKLVDQYFPTANYGPCIDISAPGFYIWVADNEDGSEQLVDGTSYATPLVSGVVAALLSSHPGYRGLKPAEFKQKFLKEFSMGGIQELPEGGTPDRMLIITELLKHGL